MRRRSRISLPLLLLQLLIFASIPTSLLAQHEQPGKVRRRLLEDDNAKGDVLAKQDEVATKQGADGSIFGSLSNFLYGNKADDKAANTGAELFKISFSDSEAANPDLSHLDISKITKQNGINGNPRNRYIWSMALDDNEDVYMGTLNDNFVAENVTNYMASVFSAPWNLKWDAIVDSLLRQWSGTPIFEHQGGEIYKYHKDTDAFQLVLKADPDFVGFRNMINYQGAIYAGSTNGPEGPYDGEPYDFEFYKEGIGAKIFTNAGSNNDTFTILDDEGSFDSYDKAIRAMCTSKYSNRLFIGTETYKCAKLVVYDNNNPTTDGSVDPITGAAGGTGSGSWKKIELEGEDCTLSVSDCLDLGDGRMLFGTWAQLGYNVYLLDEKNNDQMTKLYTPQWWYHISMGVMEIRVFKGYLYVGVLSFVRGMALARTAKIDDLLNLKEEDWTLITGNGFGQEQKDVFGCRIAGNEYPWATAEINGIYFIGTVALVPRGIPLNGEELDAGYQGQLWASKDGWNWNIVTSELFDEANFLYGFRTMQVTKDQKTLYIGSAANMYIPDPN